MQRYPLTWPTGWRRFPPHLRKRAKFNSQSDHRMGESIYHRRAQVSVCDAVERVFDALSKMGIIDAFVTISSNLQLRNDGLPRSGQPEPSDPGVAVYWREPRSDARKVIAIDRYDRCADNLAAIAASLEAMRAGFASPMTSSRSFVSARLDTPTRCSASPTGAAYHDSGEQTY